MKLLVLCLLAGLLCCTWGRAPASKEETTRTLRQALDRVGRVRDSLQPSNKTFNSPPRDVADCCCLSALECFRANIKVHFDNTDPKQIQLHKSLKNERTLQSLTFCKAGTNTTTCESCDAHPKVNAREFFNSLESLIVRGIARLSQETEQRH